MKNKKKKHLKKSDKKKISKQKLYLLIALIFIILMIVIVTTNVNSPKDKKDKKDETASSSDEGIELYDTLTEYVKETDDGTKLNTSVALNTDKKIGNLDATDIQLIENGGITTLTAKVTNNTDEATSLKNIWVVFLDKDGNELYRAKGVVGALEPNESTNLNISMSSSYVTAYDIEFKE